MARFFLMLCLICLPGASLFAHLVRGTVTDKEGEPIPYANVYIANTTNGVVTNIKGEYFLELKRGSYTVVFQSLGYQELRQDIEVQANLTLDVTLEAKEVKVETVEITAGRKDPAYAIMEKVIARKRDYVKQFDTYQAETYLKVTLEKDTLQKEKNNWPWNRKSRNDLNDDIAERAAAEAAADSSSAVLDTTLIADSSLALDTSTTDTTPPPPKIARQKLNFIESRSTTYFAYPNQFKSIVHGYRDMTENKRGFGNIVWNDGEIDLSNDKTEYRNPFLFYTDVSDADINFYRNLVVSYDLGDRPFISPLSSTSWKLTYKYKLEEQFMEEGRVIYKIHIEPRLAAGPYFEGHIYIVDGLWAIKSVNLKVNPSTLSFFDYFQIIHNYEMTEDNRWVLAREDYYYNTTSDGQRHYGSSIAIHSDYQLDVEFPKNFFRNEIRRMEDEARDRDSSYWEGIRPLTLKTAEVNFIRERDSINTYHQSKEYMLMQDSMYNEFKFWDPIVDGITYRRRSANMSYFLNPLLAQVRPWGVGGYRHALGGWVTKGWDNYQKLIVSGEVDYGFKNQDLRGKVNVGFIYAPKHFGKVNLRYGNTYVLVNNFETIQAIFSRGNFVQKIFYGASHEWEIVNGIQANVGFSFADRKPIADLELTEWSDDLFGNLNQPQDFSVYREAIFDVTLRITPRQKYMTEPRRKVNLGSRWPTFVVKYRKAIPDIFASDLNYDFLEISAQDEWRPGTWGVSRWSTRAGRFLQADNLRFTDYTFFRGSDPYLFANPLRAFQLLGPTISTPNGYFQANYIHDFGGALLDKVPLLNRTNFQLSGGGGLLFVEDGNFFHSEIYSGLQYAFRIKGQLFKLGGYYVTSYSNVERALQGQIKFGITFFDNSRNRWNY